jgi:hypothetical protein
MRSRCCLILCAFQREHANVKTEDLNANSLGSDARPFFRDDILSDFAAVFRPVERPASVGNNPEKYH